MKSFANHKSIPNSLLSWGNFDAVLQGIFDRVTMQYILCILNLTCFSLKVLILRWLVGLRKLRSSKRVEILPVVLGLRVAS